MFAGRSPRCSFSPALDRSRSFSSRVFRPVSLVFRSSVVCFFPANILQRRFGGWQRGKEGWARCGDSWEPAGGFWTAWGRFAHLRLGEIPELRFRKEGEAAGSSLPALKPFYVYDTITSVIRLTVFEADGARVRWRTDSEFLARLRKHHSPFSNAWGARCAFGISALRADTIAAEAGG